MSRRTKIALGFAAIWPLIYAIPVVVFTTPYFDAAVAGSTEARDFIFRTLVPIAIFPHILAVMCVVGMVKFSLNHVQTVDYLRPNVKKIWTVLLMLGHMLVIPVYWYLFIRREPGQLSAKSTSA